MEPNHDIHFRLGDEIVRHIQLAAREREPFAGDIASCRRDDFAALLDRAYRIGNPAPGRLELEANDRFARQAPELIVALSSPTEGHKIPLWEQQLSCGAACMNLLLATHALGYAAGWVTGWAAYSPTVLEAFGQLPERIAGFIFLGTPGIELEERLRPGRDEVISEWISASPGAVRQD